MFQNLVQSYNELYYLKLYIELIPKKNEIYGFVFLFYLLFTFHVNGSFLLNSNNKSFTSNFLSGWSLFVIFVYICNLIFNINIELSLKFYIFISILTFFFKIKNLKKNIFFSKNIKILALLLPLFLLIFTHNIFEWDSFAYWVPNAEYIFENFQFPDSDFYQNKHPFASQLIGGAVFILSKNTPENIHALFALYILLNIFLIFKKEFDNKINMLILFIFVFYNPLIINSKTFTAYNDLVLGLLVLQIFVFFKSKNLFLSNSFFTLKVNDIFYTGLLLSLLLNLKNSAIFFFIIFNFLIFISYFNFKNVKDFFVKYHFYIYFIISIFCYLIWRVYLINLGVGFNLGSHFRFEILDEILLSMFKQLTWKPFFSFFLIFSIILSLINISKKKHILINCSFLIILIFFNLFLIMSYLKYFSFGEAKSAASYWRYISHIGPLIAYSLLINLDFKDKFIFSNYINKKLFYFLITFVIFFFPYIFINKFRADIFSPYLIFEKNREYLKNISVDKKILLFSLNPQINRLVASYYLKKNVNYSRNQSDILSFDMNDFEKFNIEKFDKSKYILLIFHESSDKNKKSYIRVKFNLNDIMLF